MTSNLELSDVMARRRTIAALRKTLQKLDRELADEDRQLRAAQVALANLRDDTLPSVDQKLLLGIVGNETTAQLVKLAMNSDPKVWWSRRQIGSVIEKISGRRIRASTLAQTLSHMKTDKVLVRDARLVALSEKVGLQRPSLKNMSEWDDL
jgi:hypothetical protein